jgi:hypothetical protein
LQFIPEECLAEADELDETLFSHTIKMEEEYSQYWMLILMGVTLIPFPASLHTVILKKIMDV